MEAGIAWWQCPYGESAIVSVQYFTYQSQTDTVTVCFGCEEWCEEFSGCCVVYTFAIVDYVKINTIVNIPV